MADACVAQGVTKVNGHTGRMPPPNGCLCFPDNKGRAFLCPSVTLFVSSAVEDGAHAHPWMS